MVTPWFFGSGSTKTLVLNVDITDDFAAMKPAITKLYNFVSRIYCRKNRG